MKDLEPKLGQIIDYFTDMLARTEMTDHEFNYTVWNQFRHHGLIPKDKSRQDHGHGLGLLVKSFKLEIGADDHTGIKHDYVMLDSNPRSQRSSEDIKGYEALKSRVCEEIPEKFAGQLVTSEQLSNAIKPYTNISGLPQDRRNYLTVLLSITTANLVHISTEHPLDVLFQGSEYTWRDITNALDAIKQPAG